MVEDRWEQGEAYERYIGRWSRPVAARFLTWLGAPRGIRWLDVGCGTGALTEAILERGAPAEVIGVEPSAGFLDAARARLGEAVVWRQGDAAHLPVADGSVDAVVSGLVLNFVPDPAAALAEMVRVAAPGGRIGAYVWDYGGGMQVVREFWVAAAQIDPDAAGLDESLRFPLCRPEALTELFSRATGDDAEIEAIEAPAQFADFDDYWLPFLGGQGPAPSYLATLDDGHRAALRDRLRERLPSMPDGSIELSTRAWAVRARVA
jgi:SAM-dependent methyltransferase